MNHYIMISGNGRSGSNRLLDILDRSAFTACRNEMNGVQGGDFWEPVIGAKLFREDLTPARQEKLEYAVSRARARRSDADRPPKVAKPHFRPQWLSDAVHWATSKDKLRAIMGRTPLLETEQEWNLSSLYTDHAKLAEALLVMKLNGGPSWTMHLHDTDPNAHIIHNIRDPRAYLNSWYNRFAMQTDLSEFEQHFPDVPRILAHFGHNDADRLRDLSKESLMEIELWRWRYTNETLHQGLADSERAITVTYADVDADPRAAAEKVYAFAGLEFNDEVAELVQTMRNTLFAKKHAVKLENSLIDDLVDKVLDGSPLKAIPNLF